MNGPPPHVWWAGAVLLAGVVLGLALAWLIEDISRMD